MTHLALVAVALPCNGKHPPKHGVDSVLTVSNKTVDGLIRAKNPTHRRFDPGTGCGRAAIGCRRMAPAVDAADPLQGCAGAEQGGTSVAACRNTAKEAVQTQLQIFLTQPQGLKTLSHQRGDGVK